jgi:Phage integrase, N-terminal SAM-like domain
MRPPELSRFVTDFFRAHLGAERNASRHTTLAYRDALKLFLRFAADWHGRPVDRLAIGDLTPEVVLAFLDSLEAVRHNAVRTRNARLAAIHCFFRHVLDCEPAHAALCQRILVIPVKKAMRPALGYLSDEELGNLLGQVDRSTREGRRDYLLLALLYDTGTSIQELLDMTPADFHLTSPAFVRVLGKGKKERLCPHVCSARRLQNAGESRGEPRRGASRGAEGSSFRPSPSSSIGGRATTAQPRTGTAGPDARRAAPAVLIVAPRVSAAHQSRSRHQLGAGGSLDLVLSFSTCAISSSSVAHPCRYRQTISKVRSVGLPPVQRWISRQAMIAQ